MRDLLTKKNRIIAISLVCLLLFVFVTESRAEETTNGEIIILIDASGSIEGYKNEIREWAEKLGAYVQGMEITVELRSFGNPGNNSSHYRKIIENPTEHDEDSAESNKKSDLEMYMDALEGIGSSDAWTDQKGAMEKAIQTLNSSSAPKRCIIMLSDGKLDYENDANENDARAAFAEAVDAFAREKNNEVILVQFGSGDEIFKLCSEATVLDGREFSEPALQEISESLGIKMEKGEGEKQVDDQGNTQITFQLEEKDYYRVILNIRATGGGEMSRKILDEITVSKGEVTIEKDAFSLLSQSCYIYIDDPAPGNYTVSLPDGEWDFYYVSQEKIKVREIYLSVLQEGRPAEYDGDAYQISGTECILEIEVSSDPSEQLQKENVQYRIFQFGGGYQGIQGSGENGIYVQPLILNGDDEIYECQVKVCQGTMEEESDIIKIKINMQPSSTPSCSSVDCQEIQKEVGESIHVRTEFDVDDNEKDYFVFINGDRVFQIDVNSAKDEAGTWKYEKGELTFLEEMEYVVEVKNDGVSRGIRQYNVQDVSFWEKIKQWFAGLFR